MTSPWAPAKCTVSASNASLMSDSPPGFRQPRARAGSGVHPSRHQRSEPRVPSGGEPRPVTRPSGYRAVLGAAETTAHGGHHRDDAIALATVAEGDPYEAKVIGALQEVCTRHERPGAEPSEIPDVEIDDAEGPVRSQHVLRGELADCRLYASLDGPGPRIGDRGVGLHHERAVVGDGWTDVRFERRKGLQRRGARRPRQRRAHHGHPPRCALVLGPWCGDGLVEEGD